MSGVNILPKARTGQLPLALAERPLDRNGAVKGPPALSTGPQGSELLSVMMDKELMGLTARVVAGLVRSANSLSAQSRAESATSDMPPSKS